MTRKLTREIFIQLAINSKAVKGFAGCNTLMAQYETRDNSLKFSFVATSRKLCPDVMQLESTFISTLESVTFYAIKEHELIFFDV